MSAIEAVIFDYGGVLSTAPFEWLRHFEAAMGYPEKSVSRLLFGSSTHPTDDNGEAVEADWQLLETGRLSLADFHHGVVARSAEVLGAPLDLGSWQEYLRAWSLGIHWMVIHRVRELRAEGYGTAILTNNVAEWGPGWRATIPLELFDVVIDSSEVGLRKPDPAIFRLTCERLGVAPEAAVFLDDSPSNVNAAREVGLHGIVVSDPVDALAELERILEGAPR